MVDDGAVDDGAVDDGAVDDGAVDDGAVDDEAVDDEADAEDAAQNGVELPIESSIDLHAFAPRDIVSVVDDYLTAAHAAGFREVRLIHGRGHGVQRGRVQSALERHPLVIEFWDAPESHLGATIARLRD